MKPKKENISGHMSTKSLRISNRTGLVVALLLIFIMPSAVTSQECKLRLTALNNIESVNQEGREYFIDLINDGDKQVKVELAISESSSGSNPDGTAAFNNNVSLPAEILNEKGVVIKPSVELQAKTTKRILVKVTVPEGTRTERWSSHLVTAKSQECEAGIASIVLYTFVPGSGE